MPDPRHELAEYCTNLIEGIAFADTGDEAAEHIATVLGWRPPLRRIETDAELHTAPAGIVVRASDGTIAARHPSGFGVVFGHERPFDWSVLRAPAVVLLEPEPEVAAVSADA